MERALLVKIDSLEQVAQLLTGYGRIDGIDHEGTIRYTLMGDDAFDLGRTAEELERELRAYFTTATITKAR